MQLHYLVKACSSGLTRAGNSRRAVSAPYPAELRAAPSRLAPTSNSGASTLRKTADALGASGGSPNPKLLERARKRTRWELRPRDDHPRLHFDLCGDPGVRPVRPVRSTSSARGAKKRERAGRHCPNLGRPKPPSLARPGNAGRLELRLPDDPEDRT